MLSVSSGPAAWPHEKWKILAACQANCLAGLLHAPNQWFTVQYKVPWKRRRGEKPAWCLACYFVLHINVCLLCCVSGSTRVCPTLFMSKNIKVWLHGSRMVKVCVFVFVSVHTLRKMDIYFSSWLHFPGRSLMALCSGAELLLPTYFMTSCSPHANNSASLLTHPSLILSACYSLHSPFSLSSFFFWPMLLFFFLQMPKA